MAQVRLIFLTPPSQWLLAERQGVADILSTIACELLKGEHMDAQTIEIEAKLWKKD